MNRTLIVFAKEPASATVKTRLRDCLSPEQRVRLYKAFVKDTLAIAHKTRNTRKILACYSIRAPLPQLYPGAIELISGKGKIKETSYLKNVSSGFELIEQKGRTLGDRMYNAFRYANETKSLKTVIIGTDAPTLPAQIIEKAFCVLNHNDLVIGPSVDGGYYLIGMKAPCAALFTRVRWGTASVLQKTLANAGSLRLKTALLALWYDVDDKNGLTRLRNELRRAKNTAGVSHTARVLNSIPIL